MRRGDDTINIPAAFHELRADYSAGTESRFRRARTGLNLLGSGADYHYRDENKWLRAMEYARDMARNDTCVGPIVDRAVYNVLQGGLTVDPQTGDSKLDDDLKAEFTEWSTTPAQVDVAGRFALHDLAEHALRAMKVDGDSFILPRDNGQLQFVEAHRCRTPSRTRRHVIHGVLIDEWRRPIEYWFTNDDLDPLQSLSFVRDVTPYAARDSDGRELVWHIADPRRVTQTRGFTAFAPVFDALGMLEDTMFAQLVKAMASACFVFIRQQPSEGLPGRRQPMGSQSSETMTDASSRLIEQLAPGTEVTGRPGETIQGFSPQIPNPEFFEHAKLTLKLICACMNVPLVSFMLDGSETNFSGWRGAVDQAKIGWRREQQLIARLLYLRAYRHCVDTVLVGEPAFRAARTRLGERTFYNVRINAPRWPYIQPLQDIEAEARELQYLLTSPRRQAMERGADIFELTDETVEDNRYRIVAAFRAANDAEKAIAIETSRQVQIDPAQLLHLDPSRPLTIAAPAAPMDTEDDQREVPPAV